MIGQIAAKSVVVGAVLLFVLALPLALALSNFRWFVYEPANYLQGQQRHAVTRTTGLSPVELAALDRGLVRYLQSDRRSLQASLEREGVVRSPFSDRDAAHLVDVHDLIRGVLNVQWLAMGYGLLFVATAIVGKAWRLVARSIIVGSLLTMAVFGLLGLLSLLDWDALFLQFHFVSFNNELWRLDPSRDALIRLYPPDFFMDATVQLVAMSVAEALLLAALAAVFLRRSGAMGRRTG